MDILKILFGKNKHDKEPRAELGCSCCSKIICDFHYGFESILLEQILGWQCSNCGHVFCYDHRPESTKSNDLSCPDCKGKLTSLSEGPAYSTMVEKAIIDGKYDSSIIKPPNNRSVIQG